MNHSEQIKILAEEMIDELYSDQQYSKDDLMNALVIVKPILISLVIKNARNLGSNKQEVLASFRELMKAYKNIIEEIVGFELNVENIKEDYGILEDGVLE